MRFLLARFVLATLAASLAVPAPATAYLYRQMRDWFVTCDNGLTCALQYDVMQDPPGITSLAFERSAAPGAPVELVVGVDARSVEAPEALTFTIDGESALVLPFEEGEAEGEGWIWRFSGSDDVAGLLAAMKDGTAMQLRLASAGEPVELDVPLAGVTAGLLFIDEAQGRIGRADALEATGDAPVPDQASVRTIDAVADLPASIRFEFEGDDALCGGLESGLFGAFVIDGGEGSDILGAPCGLGGAYNQSFALYAGEGDAFRAIGFPIMGEEGPTTMSTAFNLSYEPVPGHLTAFFKGRGLGDCGSYHVWRIDSDMGGPALTLLEARAKGECDGDYAGGPENWPLVWPAE